MLIHQVPSHSHALDGGNTHFYEEDRIRCIAFNFEVIIYKPLMYFLNIPPRLSRNVAPPYFTTIQDNMDDKSVSTQNIPKVVKGNLKVTAKTTLERNWLFFLERDLSYINLKRPDIRVNNLKLC